MKSTKNHEVKSIITKKQGTYIAIGLIILVLAVTGKFNLLFDELSKWFSGITISLPSIDFASENTIIYLLVAVFILIIIIGAVFRSRDDSYY